MAVCAYCEREMTTGAGCDSLPFEWDGRAYSRLVHDDDMPCHDCRVQPGSYHHPGCDAERCPICSGQAISCDCYDAMDMEG